MQQHGRHTTAETLGTESLEYWGSFVVYNAGTGSLNTLEEEVLGGFEDRTGNAGAWNGYKDKSCVNWLWRGLKRERGERKCTSKLRPIEA